MSTYTDFMCKSLIQTVLIQNKEKIDSDNFTVSFYDVNNTKTKEENVIKHNLEKYVSEIFAETSQLINMRSIEICCIKKNGEKIEITTIEIN